MPTDSKSEQTLISVPAAIKRTLLAPATFSVSARVAMQLGRESISSSNTAIIELVKNAYDADAELVSIRFAGLGTPEARLVVEDTAAFASRLLMIVNVGVFIAIRA